MIIQSQYIKVDRNQIFDIVSQFSSTIENIFANLKEEDNLFNNSKYLKDKDGVIPYYDRYDMLIGDKLVVPIYLTVGILNNIKNDQLKHITDGNLVSLIENDIRCIIVGFNVYLKKKNFNKNKLMTGLSFVLSHEITHVKQELFKNNKTKQIDNPSSLENFPIYYNSQTEVEANLTAVLNGIQDIFESNPSIIDKFNNKKELFFYVLSLIPEWKMMKKYLNDKNMKYVLKKCHIVISNILENYYE